MAYEENRPPLLADLLDLGEALLLKLGIANRQHLVYQQDFCLHVDGHGKSQAHVHATRVVFHRCLDKVLHLGKSYDSIELSLDFSILHPKNCTAQVDVVASGQFSMKA